MMVLGLCGPGCAHPSAPPAGDAPPATVEPGPVSSDRAERAEPTPAAAATLTAVVPNSPGVDPTPIEMSMEGFPTPVDRHTAVWTGDRVIFWGGNDAFPLESNGYRQVAKSPRADGGIYDPGADAWTPVPTAPVPPRLNHVAVWSGTEMIVFCGEGPKGPLSAGAAFNPKKNRWRKISTLGAPTPRTLAAAVWTGERMVVAGGVDERGVAAGGAFAYDPKRDRWEQYAPPPPRTDARMVWTGQEVIVWGTEAGIPGGERLRADGSWVRLPTDGAPTHPEAAAVWGGGSLLVWGGVDPQSIQVAAGARWSSKTDAWSPIDHSGAYARFSPAVVSTGDLMLVLGEPVGDDDGSVGSLDIYNVELNRWWTIRGPYPSADIAAVWTGTELIAWGGFDGTNMSPTGERVRLR